MKILLLLLSFVCTSMAGFCQTEKKHDVILKTNGDEISGDVLEIGDSTIRFSYTGEKIVYVFKKSDVSQITFASGRVEKYTIPPVQTPSTHPSSNYTSSTSPDNTDRHNKVAILPFSFLRDGQLTAQQVSEDVQNQCYNLLSKHSGVYTVILPRETNVKLAKANITPSTMINFEMDEICKVLGVEYIVDGTVTQNKTTQSSYGNTNYNATVKDDNKSDKTKVSSSGSTSSTTVQSYENVIDMKIYNDKNDVVYSQNRKSFLATGDAYKNTIEYLLKRCPLYTK